LTAENHEDLLRSTAQGPEGEPQNNPVWFDWDGEHTSNMGS